MGYVTSFLTAFLTGLLTATLVVLIYRLKHYQRLSCTDELTQIDNYRGFRSAIPKIIERHRSNKTSFTLALLDIDQFRRFNNESYAFGDKVLLEFIQYIIKQLPPDAYIARFRSGDEFIVILHCDMDSATSILSKAKSNCQEKIFAEMGNNIENRLSFSFGCTDFQTENDTLESMIERTEKALHESKTLE